VGGSIVEYSARTGRTPSAQAAPDSSQLITVGRNGRLRVAAELLEEGEEVTAPRFQSLEASGTAEVETGFLTDGWASMVPTRLTREDALDIAESFLDARMPSTESERMLEQVSEILATPEGEDVGRVVGYSVRFSRQMEGHPIRGNGVADHVSLLISGAGVIAWSAYWPEYTETAHSIDYEPFLLTVGEAITLAADDIARAFKGESLSLVEVRPVLGTYGPHADRHDLRPAYEFASPDGQRVVVDAVTGLPIR
jgi:hypothetical protein